MVKGMVRVRRLPMGLQDLSKLKVEELTPLTPEVISRQATINIGKSLRHLWHDTGPAICAKSALRASQEMTVIVCCAVRNPADKPAAVTTNQQRSKVDWVNSFMPAWKHHWSSGCVHACAPCVQCSQDPAPSCR